MRTLNIIVSNIQGQTKPVYNLYKNNLDNILDSNIDSIVAKIAHTKSGLLKQGTSITQPCMPQNINVL